MTVPRGPVAWTLAVGLALVGASLLWLRTELYESSPFGQPVLFEVPQGASLTRVGDDLVGAGLLESGWRLKLAARLEGGSRSIHAGFYEVVPGTSPVDVLRLLVEGRVSTIRFTVPEGLTVAQLTTLAADSLALDPEDVREAIEGPAWRQRLELPETVSLEGYLFPETYQLPRGAGAEDLVSAMVGTFESMVQPLRSRVDSLGWSLHEVLTLASIVEAETRVASERSQVAAVYRNRIDKGWRLEADPTVAYAVDKVGEPLTYRDLQAESAYNTYRNEGLPPGPINSPGLAAIEAVLSPEPDFDAMYFVADGEGGHVFSRTWEEHRKAVREYRRKRDQGR